MIRYENHFTLADYSFQKIILNDKINYSVTNRSFNSIDRRSYIPNRFHFKNCCEKLNKNRKQKLSWSMLKTERAPATSHQGHLAFEPRNEFYSKQGHYNWSTADNIFHNTEFLAFPVSTILKEVFILLCLLFRESKQWRILFRHYCQIEVRVGDRLIPKSLLPPSPCRLAATTELNWWNNNNNNNSKLKSEGLT